MIIGIKISISDTCTWPRRWSTTSRSGYPKIGSRGRGLPGAERDWRPSDKCTYCEDEDTACDSPPEARLRNSVLSARPLVDIRFYLLMLGCSSERASSPDPHPPSGHLLPVGEGGDFARLFGFATASNPSPTREKVPEGRMRGRRKGSLVKQRNTKTSTSTSTPACPISKGNRDEPSEISTRLGRGTDSRGRSSTTTRRMRTSGPPRSRRLGRRRGRR